MSSAPSSPNSSPSVDLSPNPNSPPLDNATTTPPPSTPSTPPPTSNNSTPPPTSNPATPPPTSNPATPPPTLNPSPPPLTSNPSPPPLTLNPSPTSPPPPPVSPPPIPDQPFPVTPPPSNSEPPPPSNVTPPPSPTPPTPPASRPPPSVPPLVTPSTPNVPPPPSVPSTVTPSTPNAPPPTDISPPPPPSENPPSRPSPSPPPPTELGAPPPSPPAVISPSPSPPARTSPPATPLPKQSPPAPTSPPPRAGLPARPPSSLTRPDNTTFPPPSVPASFSPPPHPRVPSEPSIPIENRTADSTPPTPSNTTASSTREAGGFPAGGAIALVLVGVLALILVVFAAWFVQRRKKRRTSLHHGYVVPSPFVSSQNSDSMFLRDQNEAIGSANQSPYHSPHLLGSSAKTNLGFNEDPSGIGNSRSYFTYEELVGATNGFSEDNLLGEGGFGRVYKGNLADGREVAVKQLKIGGVQGEREFRAEMEMISRIHHRHLVSIVGYCISDFQRLLVYDYVPNNTLHYHLHGNVSVMTWATRFKVAAGAARGIAYLHEDCTPRIIHRDIKSANILLDNNFEAKVADFGLAKLALELEAHTHISTRVMGTFGYMAPEYATTGKLTEKSDVYSLGVVLLELITGRKPVDPSQPLGDESLVEWARPLLTKALETESFEDLVDPRLENNYVKIEMFRLIEAAAACVRHSAPKRPKMSQVVRAVDSIGEMSDLTNGMKPGESQIINSREQSAQIRMFQRMAFGNQEYSTTSFSNSQNSWSGS
ncbi:hypothetical protein LIER_28153 [Lithospermum erythrorhizon]|uniref:non-specific serine/threonine protein kinase n=1 Tax=Lithospermum erythrorhizon TaxID=34254 RepID=A0AAV3RGL0_LITER